jgi:LIVCS family branched-chain amino acid:cation transporter
MALPLLALTICLACLTTLVALAGLFAEFCQKEMFKGKIGRTPCVIVTYILCSVISFLGFDELASWIGGVMDFVYPALIVLSLVSITDYFMKSNWAPKLFYVALGVLGLAKVAKAGGLF